MSGALASALEESVALERRRGLRALLRSPVLVAGGTADGEYRLVRKHEAHLRDWLDANTGWRLTVDVRVARLHKRTTGDDPTRGFVDQQGRPFTRRRYVLVALCLAVLERSAAQTTLGALASGVVAALGDERFQATGIDFTLEGRDQRSDLAAAVRLLLDLGVLRRLDGDERRFVEGAGDVLYDVERRVLAGLITAAASPSAVRATDPAGRLAAIEEVPPAGGAEVRNRAIRWSLTRRLLDDPVLYVADLHPDERAYFDAQKRHLADRVHDATGLEPELRAEGIAMVDPEDRLTDLRMPEQASQGHLTLLIATELGRRGSMSQRRLEAFATDAQREHGAHWSAAVREDAPGRIAREAVQRLVALRLAVVDDAGTVQALPAVARFRVGAPRIGGAA